MMTHHVHMIILKTWYIFLLTWKKNSCQPVIKFMFRMSRVYTCISCVDHIVSCVHDPYHVDVAYLYKIMYTWSCTTKLHSHDTYHVFKNNSHHTWLYYDTVYHVTWSYREYMKDIMQTCLMNTISFIYILHHADVTSRGSYHGHMIHIMCCCKAYHVSYVVTKVVLSFVCMCVTQSHVSTSSTL
jgi:hypothetical protein